jgi:hypothetical protein
MRQVLSLKFTITSPLLFFSPADCFFWGYFPQFPATDLSGSPVKRILSHFDVSRILETWKYHVSGLVTARWQLTVAFWPLPSGL